MYNVLVIINCFVKIRKIKKCKTLFAVPTYLLYLQIIFMIYKIYKSIQKLTNWIKGIEIIIFENNEFENLYEIFLIKYIII